MGVCVYIVVFSVVDILYSRQVSTAKECDFDYKRIGVPAGRRERCGFVLSLPRPAKLFNLRETTQCLTAS